MTGFSWNTPPNVSLFTRAALAAADYVLVPISVRVLRRFVAHSNMFDAHSATAEVHGSDTKIARWIADPLGRR